mgnify:CR=1 FL=1
MAADQILEPPPLIQLTYSSILKGCLKVKTAILTNIFNHQSYYLGA